MDRLVLGIAIDVEVELVVGRIRAGIVLILNIEMPGFGKGEFLFVGFLQLFQNLGGMDFLAGFDGDGDGKGFIPGLQGDRDRIAGDGPTGDLIPIDGDLQGVAAFDLIALIGGLREDGHAFEGIGFPFGDGELRDGVGNRFDRIVAIDDLDIHFVFDVQNRNGDGGFSGLQGGDDAFLRNAGDVFFARRENKGRAGVIPFDFRRQGQGFAFDQNGVGDGGEGDGEGFDFLHHGQFNLIGEKVFPEFGFDAAGSDLDARHQAFGGDGDVVVVGNEAEGQPFPVLDERF